MSAGAPPQTQTAYSDPQIPWLDLRGSTSKWRETGIKGREGKGRGGVPLCVGMGPKMVNPALDVSPTKKDLFCKTTSTS